MTLVCSGFNRYNRVYSLKNDQYLNVVAFAAILACVENRPIAIVAPRQGAKFEQKRRTRSIWLAL